jgi:hypothetical protein
LSPLYPNLRIARCGLGREVARGVLPRRDSAFNMSPFNGVDWSIAIK